MKKMREIADFLFEVGMLKKTPRSGFQFLGSGCESVAEHVLRTLYIGYVLCKMDSEADELKVLRLCLMHDLPEARTGDMNYVNKKYVTVDEKKAIRGSRSRFSSVGDRGRSRRIQREKRREALLARDADQLSLILQLKECGDLETNTAGSGSVSLFCVSPRKTPAAWPRPSSTRILPTGGSRTKATGGSMAITDHHRRKIDKD